jgi:serine/threonine-protein kinase RsbT
MSVKRTEELTLAASEDVVRVRQTVRAWMVEVGFRLVDQTKMVTAASELARNAIDYGGGGVVLLEQLLEGGRDGLRITFADHGPGIPDLELALTDGYSSGRGLGMGLGGSRRLVSEFAIESSPGKGTIVTVTRWR